MTVDEDLLRDWPLPEPGVSKRERGDVVVIGGARRSPGAVLLAGEAALRVGAGRLTLAVGASSATAVATALPECGVVPLGESADGVVLGASIDAVADDLAQTDAVLVGPGLDDLDETVALLRRLPDALSPDATVVLDAYALGALSTDAALAAPFRGRLVLTPNTDEAERLLGHPVADLDDAVAELADRFGAAVTCFGAVAAASHRWAVSSDNAGLGTSGSGDVLAGAITGLAARGAAIDQAAVWGTWVHVAAGAAVAERIAPLGFLAGELLLELPHALARV